MYQSCVRWIEPFRATPAMSSSPVAPTCSTLTTAVAVSGCSQVSSGILSDWASMSERRPYGWLETVRVAGTRGAEPRWYVAVTGILGTLMISSE